VDLADPPSACAACQVRAEQSLAHGVWSGSTAEAGAMSKFDRKREIYWAPAQGMQLLPPNAPGLCKFCEFVTLELSCKWLIFKL
jgi:hypothetical protein